MISLHPIPKPPPDQRAAFPPDNLCFLAGANGLFKQVRNDFYSARVKTDEVAGLAELKDEASLNVPALPLDLFRRVESFFAAVFEKYRSEAVVLLRCNPTLREWRVVVPRQSVRGLRVSYDLATLPPAPEGFELFGTIHSHADISAFHSGTDDRDEIHFDGLHITIGDLDKPSRSYACRWMLAGRAFTTSMAEVVESPPLPPADDEWLAQVVHLERMKESAPVQPKAEEQIKTNLLEDLGAWSDFYGQEFENREDLKDYLLHLREEIDEHLAECHSIP
ncbi:MAG: hypothetical protein WCT04_24905 [Planctomycetota bacterium]